MRSVYVFHSGIGCSVYFYHYNLCTLPLWEHRLNTNHIDDVKEIKDLLAGYPTHIDESDIISIGCDPMRMVHQIHYIIRARMSARVPMLFMPAGARRGLVVLGHLRLLPRDLLREVYGHISAAAELNKIFRQYVSLISISGLYIRAVVNGVRGPRNYVTKVCTHHMREFFYRIHIEGVHGSICVYHAFCDKRQTPHFCMSTRGSDYSGDLHSFTDVVVEFEAENAIEFMHKNPRKRTL